MKTKNRKGAVSVFLCMVLLAIVVLAGAAGDACSLAVANSYTQRIHYLAAKSVLAEYDRHLFEDYGFMAFTGGEDEIASRIRRYAGEMCRTAGASGDEIMFFDLELTDVTVSCSGRGLRETGLFMQQLREIMKYQALETGLETLSGLIGGPVDIDSLYQNARDSYEGEKTALSETLPPDPETGEVPENPAERDPLELKQAAFDPENIPEGRTLRNTMVIESLPSRNAAGPHTREKAYRLGEEDALMDLGKDSSGFLDSFFSSVSSGGDKLLLMGYIGKHFRSVLKEGAVSKETFFLGEKEYLIRGKLSDKENLSAVRRELFLLRTGMNIAHIYSDPQKYDLTLTAAAATGAELFLPAVQFLIAAAWAGMEASEDMDTLMNGGKVPFMKTAGDWKLSLESIYGEKTVQPSYEEGRGLDYDGYLNLLMLTVGMNDLELRTMDLIQINMKGRYDRSFDFRNCITGFEDHAQFRRIPHLPSVLPGIIEDNVMQAEGVYEY